jgi:acyl carrier protein
MRERDSIQQSIHSFVLEKFPAARKRKITDDDSLLESGIIDSLGMLDVVSFLERTFTLSISDEELTPENFSSVSALAAFVMSKKPQLAQAEVAAR